MLVLKRPKAHNITGHVRIHGIALSLSDICILLTILPILLVEYDITLHYRLSSIICRDRYCGMHATNNMGTTSELSTFCSLHSLSVTTKIS
jgi:hypothetical protein